MRLLKHTKILLFVLVVAFAIQDTIYAASMEEVFIPIRIASDDVEHLEQTKKLMETHYYFGNHEHGIWLGPGDHTPQTLVRVGIVWFFLGMIVLHFALRKIDIIY